MARLQCAPEIFKKVIDQKEKTDEICFMEC